MFLATEETLYFLPEVVNQKLLLPDPHHLLQAEVLETDSGSMITRT
jgi:hypothetical protein